MQAHPFAHQLRREHVALDHLPGGEDGREQEQVRRPAELQIAEPRRQDEAEQRADEGNERDHAGDQADDDPVVEPGKVQRNGVRGTEDQADEGLAADEPGEPRVDPPHLFAHGLGVVARQQAVDVRHEAVPVAQQVPGDDRGDDQQAQQIENRDAGAVQRGRRRQAPTGERLLQFRQGLVDLLHARRVETVGRQGGQVRQARAHGLEQIRQPLREPRDLPFDQRHEQKEAGGQGGKKTDQNEGRRQRARQPVRLQPVGGRVEQIGQRHARDERQQDRPQRRQRHRRRDEDAEPEQDPAGHVHAGAAVGARPLIRRGNRRTASRRAAPIRPGAAAPRAPPAPAASPICP